MVMAVVTRKTRYCYHVVCRLEFTFKHIPKGQCCVLQMAILFSWFEETAILLAVDLVWNGVQVHLLVCVVTHCLL